MRTKSVTAHIERKLNTGDYSSVTFSTWATVELEDGDSAANALSMAMSQCRAEIQDAAAPFLKKSGVTVTELFGGAKVKSAPGNEEEEEDSSNDFAWLR